MARYKARDLVIKVQNAGSPSTYDSVGAIIDASVERASPSDDVTTKGSAGAQELYSAGTVVAYTVQGNGVLDNSTELGALIARVFNSDPQAQLRIVDGEKTYTGLWAIESYSANGGAAGAQRFSIQLRSAATITVSDTV